MDNTNTRTDPFKGAPSPKTDRTQKIRDDRLHALTAICESFIKPSSRFDREAAYKMMTEYQDNYMRWSYADISNYIFTISQSKDYENFNQNLETLQQYIYDKALENGCTSSDKLSSDPDVIMFEKFSDHANLAQRQVALVNLDDEKFAMQFKKHADPYSAELSSSLSKELISLVSIFTALSFLVFGGIQSLDNIFTGVGSVPIIELIIVGCIWSLGIFNLVFSFLYLISKLTKLSIRSVEDDRASLAKKYPFWVWSNFLLFFLLAIFCWIYYIDYSNSGWFLIELSQAHNLVSLCVGAAIICVVFGYAAYLLIGKKGKNSKC